MGTDTTGDRIRKARERRGMNKNQLARTLGTSWQHVDNWEKSRVEPTLPSIRRLAELLDVSADYLLGLRSAVSGGQTSLDEFLTDLAPDDLSAEEEVWLRNAPIDHEQVQPGDYATLLRDLRGLERNKVPRSGSRPKIDRAAIEERLKKSM